MSTELNVITNKMRISFDLDDTLILSKDDSQKRRNRKLINGEYLRKGAVELLKTLGEEHEILIYTTSYRSPLLIKTAFWLKKIQIVKVINNSLHTKILNDYNFPITPSKYPPHFAIDVHVDDSIGVVEEGNRYGFKVIHVTRSDKSWGSNILKTIKML